MSDFPSAMPHGDLEELFPDVFWMQGTVRIGPGIVINRNMLILRHGGELSIINAIRPTANNLGAIEALGAVKNVVKIGMHGMDDAWFVERYGAKQWAAPGMTGVDIDQELTPEGPQVTPWVSTFAFRDTVKPELALLVDRDSGLLITCDALQNWSDTERCSILAKGLSKVMGFSARPANIGPPWLRAMTPAGGSLKADFERLAALPFDHLIGGHGKPFSNGANAAVRSTISALFAD
jgi:hypothetical protein